MYCPDPEFDDFTEGDYFEDEYGYWHAWTAEDKILINYFDPDARRVYHYTTQSGLLGILSTLTFRLTDIRFFNDRTEVEHAYAVLEKILEPKGKQLASLTLQGEVVQRILRLAMESARPVRYVACFSTKPDDLNQWRAYASPGAGYSVGFELDELRQFASQHGATVGQCIYGAKEQGKIITELLDEALWQLEQYFPGRGRGSINEDLAVARSVQFVEAFSRIAPLFKNGTFQEEEEIRIIFGEPEQLSSLGFRCGGSAIIPYREASLKLPDGRIIFPQIVYIKGTENPKLTRLGIERFLVANGIDTSILEDSKVPYRESI